MHPVTADSQALLKERTDTVFKSQVAPSVH